MLTTRQGVAYVRHCLASLPSVHTKFLIAPSVVAWMHTAGVACSAVHLANGSQGLVLGMNGHALMHCKNVRMPWTTQHILSLMLDRFDERRCLACNHLAAFDGQVLSVRHHVCLGIQPSPKIDAKADWRAAWHGTLSIGYRLCPCILGSIMLMTK